MPEVMQDRRKTLVEVPVSTSIGMSDSTSVSHSRRAGARSEARGGLLAWNVPELRVETGAPEHGPELD